MFLGVQAGAFSAQLLAALIQCESCYVVHTIDATYHTQKAVQKRLVCRWLLYCQGTWVTLVSAHIQVANG